MCTEAKWMGGWMGGWSYLFFGGKQRVQTLPVNETGSSSVGRQQPNHNGYLQLIVQRKPGHEHTHTHTKHYLSVDTVCTYLLPYLNLKHLNWMPNLVSEWQSQPTGP